MPPLIAAPAAPHELLPACRVLFSDGHAERCRDRLLSDARTSGLFVARDASDRIRAAALVQTLPGALGVTWAPRGDSPQAIDAAAGAACEWLRSRGVKVCQAFADASEAADMAPLERHGFRHTTQLVSMRCETDAERDRALWRRGDGPLALSLHRPDNAQAFAQVLAETHVASLDCPELNRPRTTEEILDGFRPPDPRPNKWDRILASESTPPAAPVGVLVFDDGPEPTDREIAYLGVVPSARSKGYGGWLVRAAIAAAADDERLTVSVDARNAPAAALYARHGFVEYDRREVWLAAWSG